MFSSVSSSSRLDLGEWPTWWGCSAWCLGSPRGWSSSSPPSRCLCLVSGCISRTGIEPVPPSRAQLVAGGQHPFFLNSLPNIWMFVSAVLFSQPYLGLLTGLLCSWAFWWSLPITTCPGLQYSLLCQPSPNIFNYFCMRQVGCWG